MSAITIYWLSLNLEDLPPQELFRLCAGKDDHSAWEEFLRRYHKCIAGTVVHTARSRGSLTVDELEDIIQDVYVKLCAEKGRALRAFQPGRDDSDFSYLKVIASRVVADWFRKRLAASRDSRNETPLDTAGGVSDPQHEAMNRYVLIRQIYQAMTDIADERDRLIFWLYYRAGLTTQHIASFRSLQLGPKGVESAVLKLTKLVREKLRGSAGKAQGGTFS